MPGVILSERSESKDPTPSADGRGSLGRGIAALGMTVSENDKTLRGMPRSVLVFARYYG